MRPLPLFLMAAQAIAAATGIPIPSKGVYLGIWANPSLSQNQEQAIEHFEGPAPREINRTVVAAEQFIYHQKDNHGGWTALYGIATSSSSLSGSAATPTVPTISKVANAEGESPVIAPNTWVEVKGSNLAPAGDTRVWQSSDFVNGRMPTSLDGVSVSVNGQPAYVYYISPTQINILTPLNLSSGVVQVVATNNSTSSAAFASQAQSISPSFFVLSDGLHVAAVHLNGNLVGPSSLSAPGYTFTPASPGETILVYANGFGAAGATLTAGSATQSSTLSPMPSVTIGGVSATVAFAGLVSPGLFQFNVVVPLNAPGGDEAITASYNGAATQSGALLTLAGTAPPTSATFYVAPNGKDSWSGSLPAPNSGGTDGPFATFDRARVAIAALNKANLSQVNVQFRAGTYYLPSTEMLASTDSGAQNLQIVYQNYPGETPVFSGGVRIQNWPNTSGNIWKALALYRKHSGEMVHRCEQNVPRRSVFDTAA